MRKIIAVSLVVIMLMGCVEASQLTKKIFPGMSRENRAATEGGALGAAIGALAGQIIGKNTKSTVIGSLIGLTIGAITAHWYAKQALARQEELKGKENDLNARIQYAQNINSDAEKYNKNLEDQIKGTKSEIAKLRTKIKKNQITQKQLEKERKKIAKKVDTAKDNEELMALQLDELKEFRAENNAQSKKLDAQIAQLEKNLAKVKENTIELASLEL